jgi:hypothetical protein
LTIDLIFLNDQINSVTTIPTGTTELILTFDTSIPPGTQPYPPIGYLYPVEGFGGAIDTNGLSYFLNDPDIYVRYNGSTNTIIIQNNSGSALTWCIWVQNYLKQ